MPHGKNDAKKMMLKSLSKEMRDMMGEGLEGELKDKMMKVSVAGESPEDVEEGLDLAGEIMKMRLGEDGDMMPEDDDMSEDEDASEMAEEMMDEDEEMAGGGLVDDEVEYEEDEDMEAYHQKLKDRIAELEAKLAEKES